MRRRRARQTKSPPRRPRRSIIDPVETPIKLSARQKVDRLFLEGFVVIDCETTGIGPDAQIIELGIIDHNRGVEWFRRYQPTVPIQMGAFEVHGIGHKELESCPPLDQDIEEIKALLHGRILVAYNAPHEKRLMEWVGDSVTWVCAMQLRREHEGGRAKPLDGGHTAIGDCNATLDILEGIR